MRKVVPTKASPKKQPAVPCIKPVPDSPEGDELAAVVTTAVSMRVSHPLGWRFEVVGPKEIVDALWQQWLRFLHPELLVGHRKDWGDDPIPDESGPSVRVREIHPVTPDTRSLATLPAPMKLAPDKIGGEAPARTRRGAPRYDWAQARAWYESGLSYKEVAERLGCHWISVSEHCRKEQWTKPQDTPQAKPPASAGPGPSTPIARPPTAVNPGLNRMCWNCGIVVPDRANCISCRASRTPGQIGEDR